MPGGESSARRLKPKHSPTFARARFRRAAALRARANAWHPRSHRSGFHRCGSVSLHHQCQGQLVLHSAGGRGHGEAVADWRRWGRRRGRWWRRRRGRSRAAAAATAGGHQDHESENKNQQRHQYTSLAAHISRNCNHHSRQEQSEHERCLGEWAC